MEYFYFFWKVCIPGQISLGINDLEDSLAGPAKWVGGRGGGDCRSLRFISEARVARGQHSQEQNGTCGTASQAVSHLTLVTPTLLSHNPGQLLENWIQFNKCLLRSYSPGWKGEERGAPVPWVSLCQQCVKCICTIISSPTGSVTWRAPGHISWLCWEVQGSARMQTQMSLLQVTLFSELQVSSNERHTNCLKH